VRIKRYEAEEGKLPLILRQVRIDLGEDAVVKTRRYRKGGVLGLGSKSYVEVVAGVDDSPVGRAMTAVREPVAPPVSIIPPKTVSKPRIERQRGFPMDAAQSPEMAKLKREVELLKDMLASEGGKAASESVENFPVITRAVEPDGLISCKDLRNRLGEN